MLSWKMVFRSWMLRTVTRAIILVVRKSTNSATTLNDLFLFLSTVRILFFDHLLYNTTGYLQHFFHKLIRTELLWRIIYICFNVLFVIKMVWQILELFVKCWWPDIVVLLFGRNAFEFVLAVSFLLIVINLFFSVMLQKRRNLPQEQKQFSEYEWESICSRMRFLPCTTLRKLLNQWTVNHLFNVECYIQTSREFCV